MQGPMKWSTSAAKMTARATISMCSARHGSGRGTRGFLWLGIICVVVAQGGCVSRHVASAAAIPPEPSIEPLAKPSGQTGRLTVRPKTMATGITTAHAGLQRLDSLDSGDSLLTNAFVYVPERCVGKQRSPLLVVLHGSGKNGLSVVDMLQTFADSSGIILLGPTSFSSDHGWGDYPSVAHPNVDLPRVDASVSWVLRHYAIDPERIALYGESAGAGAALDWGYANGDVFKTIIVDSGFGPFNGIHELDSLKGQGTPKFYISMNANESRSIGMPSFVQWMQRAGYSVTLVEDSGVHGVNPARAAVEFAWLVKNWH